MSFLNSYKEDDFDSPCPSPGEMLTVAGILVVSAFGLLAGYFSILESESGPPKSLAKEKITHPYGPEDGLSYRAPFKWLRPPS